MNFAGGVGLAHLAPNVALLVLTAGVGLIYWELNRPGSIVPGALGLLATLLAVASFAARGLAPVGVLLVVSAVALLAVDLLRPTPILVAVAATLALVFGLRGLLVTTCCPGITLPCACGCGVVLGSGTSYLTRIARRARVNKGLD